MPINGNNSLGIDYSLFNRKPKQYIYDDTSLMKAYQNSMNASLNSPTSLNNVATPAPEVPQNSNITDNIMGLASAVDPTGIMSVVGMAQNALGNWGRGLTNYATTSYGNRTNSTYADAVLNGSDEAMDAASQQINSGITDFSGEKNINNLKNSWGDNTLQSGISNPTTGEKFVNWLGESYNNLAEGPIGGIKQIGHLFNGLFGDSEEDRVEELNNQIRRANRITSNSFQTAARNALARNNRNAFMNQFAEGGDMGNGITMFNTGDTHENNPLGGIPQGIAPDGLPNQVEEGEVKYEDYIFSNRLKPNKTLLKDNLLPEKYFGLTYAELAKKLQKESEDRPNDPISKQTLEDWMSRLTNAQETQKAQIEERRLAKVVNNMSDEEKAALLSSLGQSMAQQEGIDLSQPMYAKGGKIHIKPENRGKFTALKERTGHSATWFKQHGTPAQKKMATFALNAKHWSHKHADGGHLAQGGMYLDIPPYADTSSPYYGLEGLEITPKEYIPLNVVTSDVFPDEPIDRSSYRHTSYMKPISPDAIYDKYGNIRYNDLDRMYSDPNHRPTTFDGINEEKYFDMFYHPIGNKFIYESFPADGNEKWFTALSKLPEFQALKNKPKNAKEAYDWFNAYAAQERPMDDFAALVNSLRIKNSPLQTKVTTKPEGWDYLRETPSDETTQSLSLKKEERTTTSNNEWMRYAPAIGAGIGALIAGLQPIDYSLPNELRRISSRINPISAPAIGGYRRYTPYDVNLGDAENLALQAAALNANKGQNRATQGALNSAVLAKAQEVSAKRNLAAQQANEANRLSTDTYNLGIDQTNANLTQAYDQLNSQRLMQRLGIEQAAAQAADASRTAWSNMFNTTHENLWNQLGNVGRDTWNRNQRDLLLREYGPEILRLFLR